MVDMYTTWCYWCKVLEEKTFQNETIIEALNKNFVVVRLDAEEENSGRETAIRFAINGYPKLLFLNSQNQLVYLIDGYMEAPSFLQELDSVKSKINQGFFYLGFSNNKKLEYPEFYSQTFKKNKKEMIKFPKAEQVNQYLINSNTCEELAFLVMSKFSYIYAPGNEFFSQIKKLNSLFPESMVENIFYAWISRKTSEDSLNISLDSILNQIEIYSARDEMRKRFMQLDASLYFYEHRKMWQVYAIKYDSFLTKYPDQFSDDAINEISWGIYQGSTNSVALSLALKWMKPIAYKETDYQYMDTYASLLMANGKNSEAEFWALKAIELGKSKSANVKGSEDLLQKIRSQP